MRTITNEEKTAIHSLQAELLKFTNGNHGKGSTKLAMLQNRGLIYGRNKYYTNAYGNRERLRTDWFLTDKGQHLLNVQV